MEVGNSKNDHGCQGAERAHQAGTPYTVGQERPSWASLKSRVPAVTQEIQPAGSDDGPWLAATYRSPGGPSCSLEKWSALTGVSREAAALAVDSPWLDLEHPMTEYEWVKAVAMIPMILIRLLITIVVLPLVWLYSLAVLADWPLDQPLPKWRRRILLPVLRFWAGVLIRIGFGMWPVYKGLENIAEAERERAIVVYNHVSYLDFLVLAEMMMPSGLAKSGVAEVPIVGVFARALQFLYVERFKRDMGNERGPVGRGGAALSSGQQSSSTTSAIEARAADLRYPLFAIAPEGTTKSADCLLTFFTGAFAGGRPVLPVLLRYKARHFHLGWGRVESLLWHFMRVQAQFVNYLEVEVLPVYRPSPEEKADPRLYADNVRRLMGERLGFPLSPQGLPQWMVLKREGICTDWTGSSVIVKRPALGLDALRKEQ